MMRIVAIIFFWMLLVAAYAKDNGQFTDSPLKGWFAGLASKKGLCCSFADGKVVQPEDWRRGENGYQVQFNGQWLDVPPDAVVTTWNITSVAWLWPYYDGGLNPHIRCFLAGPES